MALRRLAKLERNARENGEPGQASEGRPVSRSGSQRWRRRNGWFVGRLREVPGVFSQGETLEELKANIDDAYELMREGEEVPIPAGLQSTELELDV
jgi:predicted RNase H-like HicB family nuclease